MIKPVIADMFIKSATSLSQVAETGKAATDKAFQHIFDSSMQNSNKALQSANETNNAKRDESRTAQAATQDTSQTTAQETEASKTRSDAKKAASAKADRKNKERGDSASDAKKADEKTLAGKIEKLKKSDPKTYNAMIANLDNMTLGNALSSLGLNAADMSGLKPGVDLAGVVPEDLKQALKSGDSMGIGSALVALGISGAQAGNGASVPTLASQTNMAIAGAKADAAGKSSANMKSDSQAAVTAPANDPGTTPAGQVSAKEVPPDNSKSQAASQAPTTAPAKDPGTTPAGQVSAKEVPPDNSKLQTGSSGADHGNAGLGSNHGSSSTLGANAPSPEPKPEVKAVDPFNLANPAAKEVNSQAQTDAAPQQAESKPAITVQNLTNETDQASAINAQTSKTEQTQAQPDARPANAPRQTFERMVLDQVVDKAKFVVRPNGASSMVIKLDPPTLGRIDMRVEVKEGIVRAAIVTENHDVKNAIERNMDSLKQSLHANGLKVDEISVTVGGEHGFQFKNDSMAQNASSQNQGDGRRAHHGQAANSPVAAVVDDSLPARARAYAHSGVLNVVA